MLDILGITFPVFATIAGGGEGGASVLGLSGDLFMFAGLGLLVALLIVFAVGGRIDPPLQLASIAQKAYVQASVVDAILVVEDEEKPST